jgi:hypothetical protein
VNVTVTTGEYESGTKYWLVRYRLPDGELVRKFFPDKQSAEDYAECRRRESPDAAMIPEALKFEAAECADKLRTHNWTIRRATEYILQHIIPFENKPCICDLIAIYLRNQATRGLAPDTMSEMRHRMKVYGAKVVALLALWLVTRRGSAGERIPISTAGNARKLSQVRQEPSRST